MDANVALKACRAIVAGEYPTSEASRDTLARFKENFEALDECISRGGALPTDWTWGQHPDTEQIVEQAVQRYIEAKGGSPMTMAEKRAWDKSRRLQIPAIFDPSNDRDDDRG